MEPKPYPTTDSDEVKAITIFKDSIDLKFVKANIQERSTTPNIDGFLELVDESGKPIGKLDVQIKKIPDGKTSYPCESELVSYSETTPALILICVDILNRNVFWKQICKSMPEFKPNQQTFTLHFSRNSDMVDSTGIYLLKWREIVYGYRERLSKFPALSELVQNKLDLSGIQTPDCTFFQRFIDTINNLFDNDFIAVKDLLFPGQWKIGVSALPPEEKRLHYKIYTIPYGYPSPLITKLDEPFTFNNEIDPNTVYEAMSFNKGGFDPIRIGKEFVFEKVTQLAEQKNFPVFGTAIAHELLIAFIDLFYISLGLKPSLKMYSLDDVDFAMNQYLFHVASLSFPKIQQTVNDVQVVELNTLSNHLQNNSVPSVNFKDVVRSFFIVSRGFPIHLAFNSLSLLKVKKEPNVNRSFGLPDVDLSTKKGSHWIWSGYSPENEITSVTRALTNSLKEYQTFVEGNRFRFPSSSYLDTKTSIIFEYEPASFNPVSNHPVLNEYHVVNHNLPKLNVIIKGTKRDRLDASRMHESSSPIIFDGATYDCVHSSFSDGGFLFKRTPILNLVYRMLYSDLNKHYGVQVHDREIF
jgi:hypothetical protein